MPEIIIFILGACLGGGAVWFLRQKQMESIQDSQQQLKDAFGNLSKEALDANLDSFLKLAESKFSDLVGKSDEQLGKKKELIDEEACENIDTAGVKSIKVHSVMTCISQEGVCAVCYGRDLSRGKLVSIGEAIGMIAAQSIGEPGTQLTMRTFHVGGTAQIKEESSVIAHSTGIIKIINRNLIEDSKKNKIIMGRNTQISIEDENGRQLAIYKVPYGAKLFCDNNEKVKKDTKICEWDPYTLPVIAEKSGVANYMDLVEGVSLAEIVDDATGISSKSVLDWRSQSKNTELKPRITLRDEKGNVIKKADDNEARYYLVPDSILSVKDGQQVFAGDVLARLPKATSKTKDITGGLPRVADLFEARKPKEAAILAQATGVVSWGKPTKGKERLIITEESGNEVATLIPKTRHINVFEGEKIEKGDVVSDGPLSPHDILELRSLLELTEYVVSGIQEVYRLQGVTINDKHIEVILRQMLGRVEIIDAGDSEYILGEQVSFSKVRETNKKLAEKKKAKIKFKRVLLGITKASLATDSFISAASFQETTRVLTEAATTGKTDNLKGLKENVVVGRLIPAGTGLAKMKEEKEGEEEELEAIDIEKALSEALSEEENI